MNSMIVLTLKNLNSLVISNNPQLSSIVTENGNGEYSDGDVEIEIFNREEKEIPTSLIGEMIMDKLKDLDAVAYVRFASVYREFKDVNTFMSELKKMLV